MCRVFSNSSSSSRSFFTTHQQSNRIRKHHKYPNLSPVVVPLNPRVLESHYNKIWYDERSRTFRKAYPPVEWENSRAVEQHYNNEIWYDKKRGIFRKISESNIYRPENSLSNRSTSYESRSYASNYYPNNRTASSESYESKTSSSSHHSSYRTASSATTFSNSSYSNPYSSYSRRGISRHPDNPANKSHTSWLLENGHARLINFIHHLGMSGYFDSHWRRAKAIRTRLRAEEQEDWEARKMRERLDWEGVIVRARWRNVDGDVQMVL